MLLVVEKSIRCAIGHTIHWYAIDDDIKLSLTIFNCWDGNNFYGWAISQKLPAGGFKWVENASQFAKDSMKSYNEESDEGCFLEADI